MYVLCEVSDELDARDGRVVKVIKSLEMLWIDVPK